MDPVKGNNFHYSYFFLFVIRIIHLPNLELQRDSCANPKTFLDE